MQTPPLLEGARVLDFSQYTPGPFAARLLCDLGAEVIKIEPPWGDPMRSMFRGDQENGDSPVYQYLNSGKQIARIDLKSSVVRDQVCRLIENTDILIESFRPGVLDKLGLSYQNCAERQPALIYTSLSGYGQSGPYRCRAGHDINYLATAGSYSLSPEPCPTLPLVADHSGAMNLVNAALAGLVAAGRTGCGCHIDASLYDAVLSWQYIAGNVISRQSTIELQLLSGGAACYNIYNTVDNRFVTLGALEQKFWQNFCVSLSRTDWISRQHEPYPQNALITEVAETISARTLAEWVDLLDQVDCCFEPVPLAQELGMHRQTQTRFPKFSTSPSFPAMCNGEAMSSCFSTLNLPVGEIPEWRPTE